jgi:Serine aminopeptidase, S33
MAADPAAATFSASASLGAQPGSSASAASPAWREAPTPPADAEGGSGWGFGSGGSRAALLVMVSLFVIVFIVFAAVYARYRWSVQHASAESRRATAAHASQSTIYRLVLAIFAFFLFLVVTLLAAVFLVLGLRRFEQKNLFVPTRLDRYRKLSGTVYSLPSGALVVNTTPDLPSSARRILFLHGNTGNLELYRDALDKIGAAGYNVFALEYRGYGPARFLGPAAATDDPAAGPQPNADSVVEDALEAWALMGTADGIVAGFSLGGAVLAQVYERLVPMPAQIVFLNSFGDVRSLLEDKVGAEIGAAAAPLLATRWSVRAPTTFSGKVLVVFTADDMTVPPKHGERLCQVFSKADLVCRELPRGGHKYSVFSFFDGWAPALLPALLS